MRKVLIAHGSEELTSALAKMLGGIFEVSTCTDGITALELIRKIQPYALILDLMLPFKDGLTILEEAAPVHSSVILGVIRDRSNYVISSAAAHGIGYVMLDPCDTRAIVIRLMDMISCIDIQSKPYGEPQSEVTKLLLHLGLSPDADGFKQLQVGIPLFLKDPLQRLSKELYPSIAQLCSYNSGQQVEHSIRMTIHTAWSKRDIGLWIKMFPRCTKAPSNRLFISRIAAALQEGDATD
ncbi:MAG: hypothetical protein IJF02_07240 [Oscillospiraceae bacterium]|nr:hypothetical protein [Oscillospiraceae bacterium]